MSMSPSGPDDRGYEPAAFPVPASDYPPRPPSPGGRIGRVFGVEVRSESQWAGSNATLALTVLAFRLFEPGNPQPLDVLLRGRSLSGTVRDGDWVEVAGPPDATGRWNVAQVQNLTTGATVVVTGARSGRGALVAVTILLAFVALVVVLVTVGLLAGFR